MQEAVYTVYCHTNTVNGKQYIGITKRRPQKRWGKDGIKYGGQVFGNAIDKYGWDSFAHEILATGLTKEQAELEEQRLIRELNTLSPNGYNLNSGGGLVRVASDETRKKISDSRRGIRESDEWKQHIADGVRGYKWSDSQRENYMRSRIYARGGDCKTARRVAQYTKDGQLVNIYGSVSEAQASIGNNHHISDCCLGKVGTAGGFVWKYADE